MKNLIKLTCGLALLGATATASAQIISYNYTGATVQSGSSSPYLGFNPMTGTYLLTGNANDLWDVYPATILGNSILEDSNDNPIPVGYDDFGSGTLGFPHIGIGTIANDVPAYYLSAGSIIGSTSFVGFGNNGSVSLESLAIGDTGYIALDFHINNDIYNTYLASDNYGWAEIQRDADQTYTLLATGYNTVAGQSILAGPVPEPSTLALAGLGGLGMLWQIRRRK
jgi:hypothetical protein